MKAVLLLAVFAAAPAYAQVWTWVGGPGTGDDRGGPAQPSARCCSHTWISPSSATSSATSSPSSASALYLFGGFGTDSRGFQGYLNDLWRLDLSTLTWTFLGGDTIANRGSNATYPGSRHYAVYWQDDTTQSLWIWGGYGSTHDGDHSGTYLSDLWSLDLQTGTWTQRRSPSLEVPLPRMWSNFWQDTRGNVVMFSGIGAAGPYDESPLNDLWRFSASSLEWTMVYNYSSLAGIYTRDRSARPGFREGSMTAVDDTGALWIYGGFGTGSNESNWGNLQDVWSYSVTENLWTWHSGGDGVDGLPIFGPKDQPCPRCLPPAEHAGYLFPATFKGFLFYMGGEDGRQPPNLRNDLWAFDTNAEVWTWVSGANVTNTQGSYGTKGAPNPLNIPGARYAGQAWSYNGKLWIFGGYGIDEKGHRGYLNDMWSLDV